MEKRYSLYLFTLKFLLFSNLAIAQNQPDDLVKEFFTTYQKSPDIALEKMFNTNQWMLNNQDGLKNLKNQLNNTLQLVGDYKGFEKISEVKKGQSIIELTYFVKYERQPLRFVFLYYKPIDQWRINNFFFDDKLFDN
ncbi:hypothetical protein SYJ56_17230 [Algoriphagus sp. D3-2-R+10]|uniref:hypothetical protein n=1 Tax=Algoriphagus aurantiacus TaxID=3103948 RepID=UPI002B3DD3B7|nr:hypothetical protein [Algoriphagus sp. D3-2-R+10]MEB2777063.1 hypothetical protein [Algoriphagus sp. D3-2-R+10]